ncbi:MAG: hypothetical protein Q8N37_01410 [bacterium]|nr:hypothetical protein [bacterium]
MSLAVIALLIVAMFAMIPNASAYSIGPRSASNPCNGWGSGTQVIQLCSYTYSDAWQMYYFPQYAADVVLQVAKQQGMTIVRDKNSIMAEIRGHAAIRMAPNVLVPRSGSWRWTWEIADPMDIEMDKKMEPIFYLFD